VLPSRETSTLFAPAQRAGAALAFAGLGGWGSLGGRTPDTLWLGESVVLLVIMSIRGFSDIPNRSFVIDPDGNNVEAVFHGDRELPAA
jgi:hypothetical protein